MFSMMPRSSEENVQVLSANMFVLVRYKKKNREHKNPMKRVTLRVIQLPENNSSTNMLLLTELQVEVRHTRWQKLILPTSLIQENINNHVSSVSFLVTCDNCGGDIQPILLYKKSSKRASPTKAPRKNKPRRQKRRKLYKRRPFIIINTRVRTVRQKRSSPEQCLATRPRCGKRLFYVTFEQLGWGSWVVSPKGFFANYCDGMCSGVVTRALVDEHSASSQTSLSSLHGPVSPDMRPVLRDRYRQAQSPCCSPIAKDPLTLTYYNEHGELVVTVVSEMIVRDCACV